MAWQISDSASAVADITFQSEQHNVIELYLNS
jgi:hypothetical protein